MLYTIHMMLSGITGRAELKLNEAEAKSLAIATANVARHYDVAASPLIVDWSALSITLGMIYGPRIIAMRASRKSTPRNEQNLGQSTPDMSQYVDISGMSGLPQ